MSDFDANNIFRTHIFQRVPLIQHEVMIVEGQPDSDQVPTVTTNAGTMEQERKKMKLKSMTLIQDRPHSRYVSTAIEENDESLSKMFRRTNANKLVWSSYGREIIIIGVLIMLFALFLYAATWIVTNDNVIDIQNSMNLTGLEKGAQKYGSNPDLVTTLSPLVTNIHFWFGFAILAFPLSIYIFAFLTYVGMLYDNRLTQISKLLAVNPHWSRHILKEYEEHRDMDWDRFVTDNYYRFKLFNIFGKLSPAKSDKEVSTIMTEVVRVLSIRMDGATISGYYFALILLEVIVAAAFVLPAIELARIGIIGVDILDVGQGSIDYLNSLSIAVEWAIMGVFVYSFITLMERVPRKDVTPRYYLNLAIRYILSVALASLFFLGYDRISLPIEYNTDANGVLATFSFLVGMFPNTFLRILTSTVGGWFRRSLSRDISLEDFTGLSPFEITRLWEEGVYNVDILADTTVQDLFRKTRFDPPRLQGVIGRALLWKYVIGMDNMNLILQKEKKEKSKALRENKIFRFQNIQGLCEYIMEKQFEEISPPDVRKKFATFARWDDMARSLNVPAEILRQVVAMIPDLQRRLSFRGFEYKITEVIRDEYGAKVEERMAET